MNKLKKELTRVEAVSKGSAHITRPGDNIFLDLGFAPKEAKKLRLESEKRINEKIKQSTLEKEPEQ